MWSLHQSYLNMILKQFLQDLNDIIIEYHIVEALSFQGGVVWTTVVMLGCSNLPEKCIAKHFKSSVVESQATHNIKWSDSKVGIIASSDISAQDNVLKTQLDKHTSLTAKVPTTPWR